MASAELKSSIELQAKFTIELTEIEAKALNEMTKYGIEAFLKGYKKCLGSHYIAPHERGLRDLFVTIGSTLPREIKKLDDIKKAISFIDNPIAN